jgi:hypothetical protein
MLRPYATERAAGCAPSGWQVGVYPRTVDLPILSRCEIFAPDLDEAVLMTKDRVDRANS